MPYLHQCFISIGSVAGNDVFYQIKIDVSHDYKSVHGESRICKIINRSKRHTYWSKTKSNVDKDCLDDEPTDWLLM